MKLQQVVAAALAVAVGVVGALAARAAAAAESSPVQPLPHAPSEDDRPPPPPPQSILLRVAPARGSSVAPAAPGAAPIRVPARATFRELVRLARDRAGRSGDPGAACVLASGAAGGAAGFELRAPVPASAARVGDPPRDLDARLAKRAPGTGVGVNLRAPWGSIASAYDLDLVALTPVPPDIARALATVVVATDRGFYGLHAGAVRQAGNTRLMSASDLDAFVRAQAPQADAWIVTAEGDAPMSAVRRALAAVAAPGAPGVPVVPVVLAMPLPSETSAGAQAARAPPSATISPDEACAVEAAAAGPVLARAEMEAITARLRAAAQPCADAHPGEGGVVDVVVRVGAKGFGIEACGATIPALAPAVGRCAVDAFRAVSPATGDRWTTGARIAVALDLPGATLAPLCEPQSVSRK
jgi:hypothetical protein